MPEKRCTINHYEGCLLGGAVGDALGAPVEFMSLPEILDTFGREGISDYSPAYGRIGAITDDTQMSLFTAEGIILSKVRPEYQSQPMTSAVYHAYLRWLYTQDTERQPGLIEAYGTCSIVDGILTGYRELFSQRAPGNTCLSALRSGRMGAIDDPINDSKGCGGVMRTAPVGLAPRLENVFDTACEIAALTHGHPTGYIAAGCLAQIIRNIIDGSDLLDAVEDTKKILATKKHHAACLEAINVAIDVWKHKQPSFETVETLGGGWVAEEALSIGIYCALVAGSDFRKGVVLAVNHSGDSDSSGAITGNMLGALHGVDAIPPEYLNKLELREVIREIAGDLFMQMKASE